MNLSVFGNINASEDLHIQGTMNVDDGIKIDIPEIQAPKTNLKPGEGQYDAFGITVSEPYQELYYKLTDTEATPLQVTPLAPIN